MDNVITINSKKKAQEDRKKQLLEVLDNVREQVELGAIQEIVACSLDKDGVAQIHVSTLDYTGGVGLFEIGKQALIQTRI